ncbi:MAG: NTP transferase domain-containing protein [Kofleriaceae bacterium]
MKLGAVILAAGAGSRLGGVAKALLPIDDTTYLARIASTARSVGLSHGVVVVAEPYRAAVAVHARELGLAVCVNPEPARGMASSIALGFASLVAIGELDAAWLWPVDHPAVREDTLTTLAAHLARHEAVRPVYRGRGGHPPLVARSLWDRLARCDVVDGRARAVIASAATRAIEIADPGVVQDVDTPGDRERVR